jgi:hypothetical protein
LIGIVVVTVIGPSLPDGNPLRVMGEAIRDMLSGLGSGFGGGYQPITP